MENCKVTLAGAVLFIPNKFDRLKGRANAALLDSSRDDGIAKAIHHLVSSARPRRR